MDHTEILNLIKKMEEKKKNAVLFSIVNQEDIDDNCPPPYSDLEEEFDAVRSIN